jgi:predicted lipase
MTSTDIMGVYPDNDMLVKEIGNYANSFKELFSQLDKWSKSGVRELVYNAKQETENMIEQSNFSVTILERLIDNCNKQFDKLSEELGHNVHECYQKETLNEIAQSNYEKILTRKNGMDFSLNLVKSKFILFNNWYTSI